MRRDLLVGAACLACACRPSGAFQIKADPTDIVVVVLAASDGTLVDARIERSADDRRTILAGDRAFAFILHAKDLARPDGQPLDADAIANVSARLDSSPPGANGACGRCLGPIEPLPWPVYAGERCRMPDFAALVSWPDDQGKDIAADARAKTLIEWPGDCGWKGAGDARCVPSPDGTLGQGRDCYLRFGANDVWPRRSATDTGAPPLSRLEHAKGCAILAACAGGGAEFARACMAAPSADEELAVGLSDGPGGRFDARFSWFARAVAAMREAGASCAAVRALLPRAPRPLVCGEEGCRWIGAFAQPTCANNVATITTSTVVARDCSRLYADCRPDSGTGCTDRPPVMCDQTPGYGWDHCDGDVKLGCTAQPQVSFHDCGRIEGGRCVPAIATASCVYPAGAECSTASPPSCTQDQLTGCVSGFSVKLACAELGFSGCNGAPCATH